MKYTKEHHIELSDGDTYIVSNKDCPLTEKEANDLGVILNLEEEGKKIPCCKCIAWIDNQRESQCPYYFKYIDGNKGRQFDCRYEKRN